MAKRTPGRGRPADASPVSRALSRIQEGKLDPLYFLHGPENFEKEDVLKTLIDAAVEPAARAFNLDILQADDMDVGDTLSRASAFPMMAPRRVVVIKHIDRLPEPATRDLLPLIESPIQTTVLVFTADKADTRRKFPSELKKKAVFLDFKIPYDNEIPDWIHRRAQTLGKRIEPDALHLLHLSVGARLWDLANELEKLAISTADRQTITREDVAEIVGASREMTIFELADAVGSRQPGPALSILKHLLEQGENPVGIVAILLRHIAVLRKACWLKPARLPRQELASRLKVPPFFVSKYLDQAARFDEASLWEAYEALLEADNQLKSRSRTPHVTLSRLICRLCGPAAIRTNAPP